MEAIDCPYTFSDVKGAAADARYAKSLGYRMKGLVDPAHAKAANNLGCLQENAGDLDGGFDDQPNQTHSVFAWTSPFDGRTYRRQVLVEETSPRVEGVRRDLEGP